MKSSFSLLLCLMGLVVQLSGQLELEWQREIDKEDRLGIFDIQASPDGGAIACGSSLAEDGSYKYFAIKIDRFGLIEWDWQMGIDDRDIAKKVELAADGGYYIFGASRTAYWLVKLDAEGNLVWDYKIEAALSDLGAIDFEVIDDEQFLFLGYQGDNGGAIPNGYIIGKYTLTALNEVNLEWEVFLEAYYELTKGNIKLFENKILFSGQLVAHPNGQLAEPADNYQGGYDYWLVQLDLDGNKLSSRAFGGTENDVLKEMMITTDGKAILAGNSRSFSANIDENDWWIIQLSEDLTAIEKEYFFGASTNDLLVGVKESNKQELLVNGSYNVNPNPSNITPNAIIKIDTLGISDILWQWDIENYDFFPNHFVEVQTGEFIVEDTKNGNLYFAKLGSKCNSENLPPSPLLQWDSLNCTGNDTQLSIPEYEGDVVNYAWKTPTGILYSDTPNLTISDLSDAQHTGLYYALVEVDGCASPLSNSIFIEVVSQPEVEAMVQDDFVSCDLPFVEISASVLPEGFSGVWSTNGEQSILYHEATITQVEDLALGENIFSWTISTARCSDFDTAILSVTYQQMPHAQDDIFHLNVATDELIIDLTANDRLPSSDDFEVQLQNLPEAISIEHLSTGIYRLRQLSYLSETITFNYIITAIHCSELTDLAQVAIIRDGAFELTIPEGITPNDDGINDLFFIAGLDQNYPDNELIILNRWGEVVHQAKPYNNDWGGEDDGKQLPEGVYFYVLHLSENLKPLKGSIHIFR